MRILGIDPSLTSTGAVLLEDGAVAWSERWAPPKACVGVDRLEFLHGLLEKALWDDDDLDSVAIEGYSYGSPNGMAALGELGGVFRLAACRRDVPIEVIPPTTWRKELLGKGNLAKDQVRLAVFKKFGVEFDSHDVLEAWCVAMTAHRRRAGKVAVVNEAALYRVNEEAI